MRAVYTLAASLILAALCPAPAGQIKIGPFAGEFGYSVALDGDTLAVGAPSATPNGEDATGEVRIYVRNGNVWEEEAVVFPADARGDDRFGASVALQGDTLIVGAPQHDQLGADAGAVYVYTHTAGVWSLDQKLLAPGGVAGERFGDDVALDASTLVAGGLASRVFVYDGGGWGEQVELTLGSGDLPATSVGVSGDWIITGPGGHIFERAGGAWPHRQSIGGETVAIHGERVLIGSPSADRGAAQFFAFNGATWVSDSRGFRGFTPDVSGDGAVEQPGGGWSPPEGGIASSEDLGVLLGVYGCQSNQGCWTDQAIQADIDDNLSVGLGDLSLLMSNFVQWPPHPVRRPRLGASLALDGDAALVGSVDEIRTMFQHSGAAHFFVRDGEWRRTGRTFAEPMADGDGFGTDVALSNGVAAVGAVGDTPHGFVVITSNALVPPVQPAPVYAELVDNGGYTNNGLRVDSIDLRLNLTETRDDWTVTTLNVVLMQPGRALLPRTSALSPADWFLGDPPPTGTPAWRNQRSSPSNWPNDYGDDNATSGLLPGAIINDAVFTNVAWFDTNDDPGAEFTFFRLAIRSNDPNAPRPTLAFTGVPLANISGQHGLAHSAEVLHPFHLVIYAKVCLADLDGDHLIGQGDLGILLSSFGCSNGNCAGDVDHDGDTDQSDLGFLLATWGLNCN